MEIIKIVGLALIATIFITIIKQEKPELALQLSIACGVVVFFLMVGKIAAIIQVLDELASKANINRYYFATILKIIGIAYIAEFGAQICRDAGANAVATKVEFAAKIFIMVLAIPIIVAIIETVLRLFP